MRTDVPCCGNGREPTSLAVPVLTWPERLCPDRDGGRRHRRITVPQGRMLRGRGERHGRLHHWMFGNKVGVDPRLVEVLANRRSVPSRQAHRGTTDPGTG